LFLFYLPIRNERANGGEFVGVDILVLGAATAGLTRAQSVKTMLAGAPEGVRGRSSRGAGTLGADHSSVQFDQIPEFSVTYWPTCAIKPLTGARDRALQVIAAAMSGA
jgi:hypothetical protein